MSTRDDSPIPGVVLRVRAVAKSLGEYGPEYDKRVWELTTDERGEVRVAPPPETIVRADVMASEGYYPMTGTVKSYELHRVRRQLESNTIYLTPTADFDYESIRYLYRVASDVMAGKRFDGCKPIVCLVNMYPQAMRHAKTERELLALREFCRYNELVNAEAANGWPTLGTSELLVSAGQRMIDDCTAAQSAGGTEQPPT